MCDMKLERLLFSQRSQYIEETETVWATGNADNEAFSWFPQGLRMGRILDTS